MLKQFRFLKPQLKPQFSHFAISLSSLFNDSLCRNHISPLNLKIVISLDSHMSLFKILRFSNQIKGLLRIQSPLHKPFRPSPLFIIRTLHSSPQTPIKKPLSLIFQEAVGLNEIAGGAQSQSKGEKNELISGKKREAEGVERRKPKKGKSLVELFGDKKEEEMVIMGVGKEVKNLKKKPIGKRKEKERVEKGKPKKVKTLIELFEGKMKEEKVVKVELGKEVKRLKEKPSEKKKEKEGVVRGKPKKVNLIEMFGGEKEEEKVDEMVIMGLGKEVRKLKEKPKGKRKGKERLEKGIPKKVESSIEMFGGEKKEEKVQKTVMVRREREDVRVLKGLSQLAETFIRHLYAKGYFRKANFLEVDKPKLVYFDNSYSRTFIKFAAYEFGKDHQEIARWLSVSHLKKVVLFGCPSLDRYDIFAAKRLRRFFKIQENTVCSECILKDSCKLANKSVWGIGTKSLLLTDVILVIALYAVELVPPILTVPDEVKDSVNQLLEEVIKLSQQPT